ncbi:type II toxin-antitoxin system VapC family toxin [Georgenia sp. Z1491]|uniref:type II toxin-antitoxin system VapC family toxin n=1 Tax=Georgenia sp. Z1491 TaxID=3416707 RepID=UPI003CF323A8
MLSAFDADVLIYAATEGHALGARVAHLFADAGAAPTGVGSLLLLPEVLSKPMRTDPRSAECASLISLLSRLQLLPVDAPVARLSVALAARHGLRAADATHLATAVAAGADRFLTNNRKDFPTTISEIDIVYPDDLPAPASPVQR